MTTPTSPRKPASPRRAASPLKSPTRALNLKNPLNVVTLFSGVGMTERGLEDACTKLKLPKPHVDAYCEIDPIAVRCFDHLHGTESETHNLKDAVNPDPDVLARIMTRPVDVLTSTFPCQCFSQLGLREGLDDPARGMMLNRTLWFISLFKPKIVLLENVPQVRSAGVEDIVAGTLDANYACHYEILNASNFGIPQARTRWFAICIRKDVKSAGFKFPEPSEHVAMDMTPYLDWDVPKTERCGTFQGKTKHLFSARGRKQMWAPVAEWAPTKNGLIHVANPMKDGFWDTGFRQGSNVYSVRGTCPTLTTNSRALMFAEIDGCLTGREAWKLMGMDAREYDSLIEENLISSRQGFKLAGNGVVVGVVSAIFQEVLKACGGRV